MLLWNSQVRWAHNRAPTAILIFHTKAASQYAKTWTLSGGACSKYFTNWMRSSMAYNCWTWVKRVKILKYDLWCESTYMSFHVGQRSLTCQSVHIKLTQVFTCSHANPIFWSQDEKLRALPFSMLVRNITWRHRCCGATTMCCTVANSRITCSGVSISAHANVIRSNVLFFSWYVFGVCTLTFIEEQAR